MKNKMIGALAAKKNIFVTLVAVMLLPLWQSSKVMAGGYMPTDKYANFVRRFSIDKAWEFSSYETNTGGAVGESTKMAQCPGFIAWELFTWNEQGSGSNDHQMLYFHLYLSNTSDHSKKLCVAKITINDHHNDKDGSDNNGTPTSIEAINHLSTWCVQVRQPTSPYWCQYAYIMTKYDDYVRDFIKEQGDKLCLYIETMYDSNGMTSYALYSTALDADDRKLIPLDMSVNSDASWMETNGRTAIKYTRKLSEKCKVNVVESFTGGSKDFGWSDANASTSGETCYLYPFDGGKSTTILNPTADQTLKYTFQAKKDYSYSQSYYSYHGGKSGCPSVGTVYSSKVTLTPPNFYQPYDIYTEDKRNGSVELTWKIRNTTGDKSQFVIERSFDKDFKKIESIAYVNFQTGNTNYSYTDTYTERNQGKKTFYYRIHRENASVKEVNFIVSKEVNTDYAKVSALTLKQADSKHIQLDWTMSDGVWTSDMSLQVLCNGEVLKTFASRPTSSTYTTDKLLPTCEPLNFTLLVLENNTERSRASNSEPITLPSSVRGEIISLQPSCGYFNDHISVHWQTKEDETNFNYFRVYRKEYGSNIQPEVLGTVDFVPGVLDYSYDDRSVVPGVYYLYSVRGYSNCGDKVSMQSDFNAVGFAQPFGVVSGQITYSGNQGVPDVAVHAIGDDNRRGYSLYFRDTNSHIKVPTEMLKRLITQSEGTLEFFDRQGDSDAFRHLAITYKDGIYTTYINGVPRAGDTQKPNWFFTYGQDWEFKLWGTTKTGWIDEIRFWNICRDSIDIAKTMNSYLNGSETGLTGYYRCDDNVPGYLFDISHTGTTYNGNHLTIENIDFDEANIPTTDQLSLRGYTDKDGNYLITNIPYTANGSPYKIVPSLGVHEFSPTARPLFFNSDAATHNSIDFTDVSSFTVEGTVMYYNTEYPVEGCRFYVDGQICMQDSKMIESDDEGRFAIQVPIGDHYITIEKDGHTFCDGGRFPAVGTYTFNKNMSDFQFVDSTTVLVVGRVAGGDDENAKPHGFGKGIANMGQAKIVLTPAVSRNLNVNTEEGRTFSVPDSVVCNSTTTTGAKGGDGAKSITILTDKTTGEFAAALPPIDFNLTGIELINDKMIPFNTANYQNPNLGSCNIRETATDTMYTDSVNYRTLTYLYKLDAIYYAEPELTVTQTNNKVGAFGERAYVIPDENDTVVLYDTIGGVLQYTLPAPVFLQNKTYRWNISAFETYTNKDVTPNIISHQPMRNAIVTIVNELGEKEVAVEDGVVEIDGDSVEVSTGEIISLARNQVQLDSAGMAEYAFIVGLPNVIEPYTYKVSISYMDAAGTRTYQWSENDKFQGYIFGGCPTGTNFVTDGPDQLLFVLRDPPGGQSYSTWEQGEKITTTCTSTFDNIAGTSNEEMFCFGFASTIGTGFGVMTFTTIKNQNNYGLQEDYEHTWLNSSSTTYEITTTKTISTQPQYPAVGTPGDVFVGVGTNMLFGNARKVYLKKEDGKYKVDVKDVISTGQTFTTDFNYTTSDIEDNVIPNYIKIRNSLLKYVDMDPAEYVRTHTNTDTVPVYITNLKEDDPRFGSDNHDSIVWKEKATPIDSLGGPSYIMMLPANLEKDCYVDQICHYNNQIGSWKHVLMNNEKAKVKVHNSSENVDWDAWDKAADKAKEVTSYRDRLLDPSLDKEIREQLEEFIKDKNIDTAKVMASDYYSGGWLIENVSLGGSVTVSASRTRTTGSSKTDGHKNTFKAHIKNNTAFKFNDLGVTWSLDAYYGLNEADDKTTSTTKTTTVGYTLSPNDYEFMSIDVYAAPDGFGPIFATRGGQTYCPYEDAEVTKYYEPGKHELHTQTVQMEKPRLRVSPASLSDIPIGGKGYFSLEMLNEADVNPDHYYWLRLYSSGETNPHGAQITVDGSYLTDDGRTFMFHPGSPITKTLAIGQSDPSILDYDSIAIILASDCNRRDDADTVYISAHFTPSCSPVELRIDKTTINSSTGDTLPIIIHGYDRTYHNLKSISLQYRGAGENNWSLIQKYYADEKWHNPTDKTELPITQASLSYQLVLLDSKFPDGAYEFRAQTACAYGENTEVYNESEIITVVKDMQQPQSLGLPSPINGIYTSDNQIYVEFNKPIQTGRIYNTNIEVTGVLNAQPIQHDVAYRLTPEQTFVAQTDAQYDLTAQDFAFVCWLYLEKDGAIFNHNKGGFSVQTDATGHLIVTLANKDVTGVMPVRFRSSETLPKNQWMYLAVLMNQTEKIVSAYVAYDSYDICLIDNKSTSFVYNQRGAVALGGETNMAQGAIHDLQLWTNAMSWIGMKSMMYATKELYRDNLYGYWPMNEGEGRVLHDKMRNRHILAPGASWYYADNNYAVRIPEGATAYMDISERNMDELTDYALEFWFRTDADGTLVTTDATDYMSVGIEEGKPYVATLNGRINLPVDQSYNDGQWHHLAILSHRLDNAQVVLDDAVLSLNTYNVLAGLHGAKMIFGDTVSQLDIDEVRLWKASITAKWIQDNRRARVAANQPGLITYFPMDERYLDHNVEFYRSSLADYAADSLYNHTSPLQPATCTLQPDICNLQPITDAPAMRVDKHAVSVKHNFVASDTKIVINITEEPALIEGTTLNISVSDIVDMHGNYSPKIKWTAFVNRNRLVWGQDQMYIEKEVLASKSFNVTFSNLSGQSEDWMLENIPNYIQVSETGGTLRPQQSQTITFTVLPSLAVGYYDPIIYLVGNEAIRTPLSLNIHVTGDKPDWTVRPEDYEYTMNLIGMPWATFMQPDTADMMAAFIGDKVAGVCHPQLLNPQTTTLFVMMDIYADLTEKELDDINHNVPINKPVTFRYWDASTGRVYVGVKPSLNDQPLTVNYMPNALMGSFANPVLFDLDARIEQAVEMRKGWNWYSFNVFPDAVDIATALPEMLPYINIMKSQEAFVKVDHVREAISGTLTEVDAYKLYKASSTVDSTIHVTGYPVDPLMIDIPIHKGWNWIGYVPQLTLSVSMALSNMEPAEGDIIKARSGFAVWHNNAWVGSLAAMTPGHGYMYFSGSADTKHFHYPSYLASVSSAPKRMSILNSQSSILNSHYSPVSPSTYSGNMTMTAIVMDGDVQVTTAEVAFFAGDECRTTMMANPDDHYYFTIPGEAVITLQPRVWYNETEYVPEQTFNFIEDADYGTFDNPVVIQLNPATGMGNVNVNANVNKFIMNEQLIIRKNGKNYNAQGLLIK